MYSKCIVSPFISTPMAIMASNGAVDVEDLGVRDVRSEVEPSRSAAAPTMPVEEDWTWDAEYSLLSKASAQLISQRTVVV
jgi:hypothetical protein